jgi:hypothetical protein
VRTELAKQALLRRFLPLLKSPGLSGLPVSALLPCVLGLSLGVRIALVEPVDLCAPQWARALGPTGAYRCRRAVTPAGSVLRTLGPSAVGFDKARL